LLDSAVKRLVAKANPSSKEVMLMVSLFRKCVIRMNRGIYLPANGAR
jgi:hypothetical protein